MQRQRLNWAWLNIFFTWAAAPWIKPGPLCPPSPVTRAHLVLTGAGIRQVRQQMENSTLAQRAITHWGGTFSKIHVDMLLSVYNWIGRNWEFGISTQQRCIMTSFVNGTEILCSWLESQGLTLATWGFLSCKWVRRDSWVCLTWLVKNFFHFRPAKVANCPNKTKAEYLKPSLSCGSPHEQNNKLQVIIKKLLHQRRPQPSPLPACYRVGHQIQSKALSWPGWGTEWGWAGSSGKKD